MARMLIADDALFVRRVLGEIAESAGHEVVAEAATGCEAVRRFAELRPDVVVLDVNMPELDGISAAEAIRQLEPSVGIVLASVLLTPDRARRVERLGVFVQKPCDRAELLAAVESVAAVAA
jgi:two-component system, chemotaxis family, chemotaxis protein CheY